MLPDDEELKLYGAPSGAPPLAWAWVDAELANAGTYWVIARGGGHPHPRPVWGIWSGGLLQLSIGSRVVARQLEYDPLVTVHLDSGVDTIIVEGSVAGWGRDAHFIEAYNAKYDWNYTIEEYGAFTTIVASTVLAWRSAGRAGRDGFRATGRWRFPPRAAER